MSTPVMRLLPCKTIQVVQRAGLQRELCNGALAKPAKGVQFVFGQRRTFVHFCRQLPLPSSYQISDCETLYSRKQPEPNRLTNLRRSLTSVAAAESTSSTLPPGYIPEPPVPPAVTGDNTSDIIEQLNALGEPTLQSLGLGSWYPSGLVQMALESLHVNMHIPWWGSIVIGTVAVRLLMFPLVILAQKNTAATHNHTPIIQKLQERFTKARQSGNPMEAAKYGSELGNYMKIHKVNPLKQMLVPLAQLPIFLSVFIGVRQMANLPVESMMTGGVLWFTDLTIPDPYYALPLLTMGTFLCTLEFGIDGVRAASMSTNMRFIMRAMPFAMLPFIINFPSAMLCYWLSANVFSFIQVMFLKLAPVKKYFNIPELVKHDDSIISAQKKPFLRSLKDTYRNSKTVFDVEEMQRKEAVKFKEAGLGAIQKTYAYDPTKVGKKSVNAKSE